MLTPSLSAQALTGRAQIAHTRCERGAPQHRRRRASQRRTTAMCSRLMGERPCVREHAKAVRAAEREAVRASQVRGHGVVIADDTFGTKPEALERPGAAVSAS